MLEKNNSFSGVTELLTLAILREQDSYVYEITKMIQELSNNLLSISQNTVYAVNYKLEKEGKISFYSKLVGKRRTRIYYHIEETGSEYYEQLLETFRTAFSGVEIVIDTLSKMREQENEKGM